MIPWLARFVLMSLAAAVWRRYRRRRIPPPPHGVL